MSLDCYACLVTSASGVNVVADAAIIAAVEIVYRRICTILPLLLLMLLYLILLSSAAITADVVKSDTTIIAAASDVYIHSATTQSLPLKYIHICKKLDCYVQLKLYRCAYA